MEKVIINSYEEFEKLVGQQIGVSDYVELSQEPVSYTHLAKIPDPAQPGKLKVSFFLNFYSDYYVMELDQENYNYALIGSSTDKYLWILSRTPQLPEDIKKKLVTAAERRGYDTNRLQWIEQL